MDESKTFNINFEFNCPTCNQRILFILPNYEYNTNNRYYALVENNVDCNCGQKVTVNISLDAYLVVKNE